MSSSFSIMNDDEENDVTAVNAVNTVNRNSKKRALVNPKKNWTLDTASAAVTTLMMENEQDIVLMEQLQVQAPRIRDDMQRRLWEDECTQWDLYQACMVSLVVELVSKYSSSFLQESLVPCIADCSSGDGHVLLRELVLSFDIMKENQDEALLVQNLPCTLMSALSSQQDEGPAWKRPWRKNRQAVHTEWMVPLAYMLTHSVCHALGQRDNLDWGKQIIPTVMELLSRSFPTLLLSDFQAGVALYGLQILMNASQMGERTPRICFLDGGALILDGLDPENLVQLLLIPNVLHLLQSAVGVPRYPLVAKFVEVLLDYSYQLETKGQEETAHTALKLMIEGNNFKPGAFAHLDSLVQSKTSETPLNKVSRKRKSTDSQMTIVPFNESCGMKEELLSPGFPLLVEITLNCCLGREEQAIEIANRMERAPGILSEEEQMKAWSCILEFLKCKSFLFLDGNATHTKLYQEKRSLLLSIVSSMGNAGRDVFLEYYQQFVQDVSQAPTSTPDEVNYVTLAAQQTVLRCMMAKYGTSGGIAYLRETFPSASLWLGDVKRWALEFLRKPPAIPASLNEDGHAAVGALMERVYRENEPIEKGSAEVEQVAPPDAEAEREQIEPQQVAEAVETAVREEPTEAESRRNTTEIIIVDSSSEEEEEEIESEASSEVLVQEEPEKAVAVREDDETADPQEVVDLFDDSDQGANAQTMETLREESEEEEQEQIGDVKEYEEEYTQSEEEVEAIVLDDDDEEEEDTEQTGRDERGYEQDSAYRYTEEDRVGDEKGYEPDTAYGFTEEEVSEAVHSEEEEEEDEESDGEHLTPLVRPTPRLPYSENDMDEADEYTASEIEVHDEESSAVDGTSALLALANASVRKPADSADASNPEMPPPSASRQRERFSDPGEKEPSPDHKEASLVATIVSKVPDEDAAHHEDNTSVSVAPSSVELSDTETRPIVSKVPTESERKTKTVDDTTNAATATSDAIAYLSEYAEDASIREGAVVDSEVMQEEAECKSEAEISTSVAWSRSSVHAHGGESPKEDMDIEAFEETRESSIGNDRYRSPDLDNAEGESDLGKTEIVDGHEEVVLCKANNAIDKVEEAIQERPEAEDGKADSQVDDKDFSKTDDTIMDGQPDAKVVEKIPPNGPAADQRRSVEADVDNSSLLADGDSAPNRDEELDIGAGTHVGGLNASETAEREPESLSSKGGSDTSESETASQERTRRSDTSVIHSSPKPPVSSDDSKALPGMVENDASRSQTDLTKQKESEYLAPTNVIQSRDPEVADDTDSETEADLSPKPEAASDAEGSERCVGDSPMHSETQRGKASDSPLKTVSGDPEAADDAGVAETEAGPEPQNGIIEDEVLDTPSMNARTHGAEAEDTGVDERSVVESPMQIETQEDEASGWPVTNTPSRDQEGEGGCSVEPEAGLSPTDNEAKEERAVDAPSRHARSHDAEAEYAIRSERSDAVLPTQSETQQDEASDTFAIQIPSRSCDSESADDTEIAETEVLLSPTQNETMQEKTSESMAMHTRSHDPRADDTDISERSDTDSPMKSETLQDEASDSSRDPEAAGGGDSAETEAGVSPTQGEPKHEKVLDDSPSMHSRSHGADAAEDKDEGERGNAGSPIQSAAPQGEVLVLDSSSTQMRSRTDPEADDDSDVIETKSGVFHPKNEIEQQGVIDTPSMHTRSHDQEAGEAADSVERSDTGSQAEDNSKNEVSHDDHHVLDSPSMHTRSHDKAAIDKPSRGTQFEDRVAHTRSHDDPQSPAMHTRSHDKAAVVEPARGTQSQDRGVHTRSHDDPHVLDSPAMRTRSHDNKGAIDKPSQGNQSEDRSAHTRSIDDSNVLDSPAMHTRSHDNRASIDEPSRGTPSLDRGDERHKFSPQVKSIEIPSTTGASPALSSIAPSVASSVGSTRRTRRTSTPREEDERNLSRVEEESSRENNEPSATGSSGRKAKPVYPGSSVKTRSSARIRARMSQASQGSTAKNLGKMGKLDAVEDVDGDEESGIPTRRLNRRLAPAAKQSNKGEVDEDDRNNKDKSSRPPLPRHRQKKQTSDEKESSSPKKRKATSTRSTTSRRTPSIARHRAEHASDSEEENEPRKKQRATKRSRIKEDEVSTKQPTPKDTKRTSKLRSSALESEEELSPKKRKAGFSGKAKRGSDGESIKPAASTRGQRNRSNAPSTKDAPSVGYRRSARLAKKARP